MQRRSALYQLAIRSPARLASRLQSSREFPGRRAGVG